MTQEQFFKDFPAIFNPFSAFGAILAFQKTPEIYEIIEFLDKDKQDIDYERIRCPLCSWKPSKASRWCCADCDAPEYFYGGCYQTWNTFETRGKCPHCTHQWRWTSCLSCHGWSKHQDWYVKKTV